MLIWRACVTLLLAVMVYGMFQPNTDVGVEPAWWYLLFGLLPSAVVLALLVWRRAAGIKAAVIHDALIAVGLALLALSLLLDPHGVLALVLLAWLGVFPVEGFVLWFRSRVAKHGPRAGPFG